jgi:thymidylate synthase
VWDGNSRREFLDSRGLHKNEVNDLGPIYGHQWRHFNAEYVDCHTDYSGKGIDQLNNVINDLKRADKPNIKMMSDLTKLKAQILSSKMPINKKNQLVSYINDAEKYFNLYQTSLDGIQVILDIHLKT